MEYALGVDLGTTFTAAAIHEDGRAQMATLGTRSAEIPSVVFVKDDHTVLAGEVATRRAVAEPDRVAREFKRRIGDSTPIVVGNETFSAEALMSQLLATVVGIVSERQGNEPGHVTVSHPANWGPYKKSLLESSIAQSGLDRFSTITEPMAAAIHYAVAERIDEGEVVAVYDLGGGTFDAAVLRRTANGFEPLGQPEGIERLGGIDFDAAIFRHVQQHLGSALETLDPEDPMVLSAVATLRRECIEAKEALSADTDTAIPVLLPNFQTDVRITRIEFERMIRPLIIESIEALRRALRLASVTPDDVTRVLLVGGSSRIPLVGELVGEELGRPVAVDAHAKYPVAMGAAIDAASHLGAEPPAVVPPSQRSAGDTDSDQTTLMPETVAPAIAPGGPQHDDQRAGAASAPGESASPMVDAEPPSVAGAVDAETQVVPVIEPGAGGPAGVGHAEAPGSRNAPPPVTNDPANPREQVPSSEPRSSSRPSRFDHPPPQQATPPPPQHGAPPPTLFSTPTPAQFGTPPVGRWLSHIHTLERVRCSHRVKRSSRASPRSGRNVGG